MYGKEIMSKLSSSSEDHTSQKFANAVWRWVRRIAYVCLALIVAVGLFIGYQLWGPVVTSGELTGLSRENIQGPIDAPIRIVEFGDFGCPACRRWHRSGIKKQVVDTFGNQVSFTYRHFPVISEHSVEAAIAAQCAGEQGAFWKYHDFLYEQAQGLTESELARYAMDLGLDIQAFETCSQSKKMSDYVERDKRSALREGARGTPAFFVNGQLVYNPSFEDLKALIEDH
jgi:protein-disulfide isomerase